MTLAKPVLRGTTVFLGEGMILSESVVERLRTMEIDHVYVEGQSEQSISAEEALRLLDERFRNTENSNLMMHLKKIVGEHITDLYE